MIHTHHRPGRNYTGPSAERLASAVPADARAIIERETRSAMQSGRAGRRGWRLRFERQHRQGIDPFTGWTSGSDPLTQIELRFPDLASAIRYAERHDLAYEVREPALERRRGGGRQAFQTAPAARLCCWPAGPHALCCGDYPVLKEMCPS